MRGLILALVGFASPLLARGGEVGVEALLWRPSRSDFGYVLSCDANGKGTEIYDEPELDPGVRVFLSYCCQSGFRGRLAYTYFETSFSSRRTGTIDFPILQPVFASVFGTPLSLATAKIRDRFQTVDADVWGPLYCGCRWSLEAFGGARWVELRMRERYHYEEIAGQIFDVIQNSWFCGAGPRIGLHTTFTPWARCPSLYLDGVIATSAIIANRSNYYNGELNFFFSGDSQLARPSSTQIVPAFDIRVGTHYTLCCGCCRWILSVAYELQWYQNARERLENAFNVGYPSSEVRGVGYGGLNFGLTVGY
ncbi:MAG: Lpg1974 family pore-forming outer membrane protein [Parachlamydiales bacterium]